MKSKPVVIRAIIRGQVQGVGFRFFALDAATERGLRGWVRNLPDGDVECCAEGSRTVLEDFLNALRKGPPLAQVDSIQVDWHADISEHSDFRIL